MSKFLISREAGAAEPEPKDLAAGGHSSQEEHAAWARPSPNCWWREGRMSS